MRSSWWKTRSDAGSQKGQALTVTDEGYHRREGVWRLQQTLLLPRDAIVPAMAPSRALNSPRFADALGYAKTLHAGQHRKGTDIPYIAHLLGVASLALEHRPDEDLAIAALLHDAVEDQGDAKTLKKIRQLYGDRVADIVDGCSDTDVVPKPPWRRRKEVYLDHLKTASDDVRFVSACDKLHNLRAIIRDYRTHGDTLWKRFNGGKDGTLWYYAELAKTYRKTGRTALVDDVSREVRTLQRLVRARTGARQR